MCFIADLNSLSVDRALDLPAPTKTSISYENAAIPTIKPGWLGSFSSACMDVRDAKTIFNRGSLDVIHCIGNREVAV